MIAVREVAKRFYDSVALDDITLEVPSGSLTALLGPSGSGKTTLLRIVAGLEEPDRGCIEIDGRDATGAPPQRRGIGFVFQSSAAFAHMTVRDNIAFGLRVRRQPKRRVRERVAELLDLVGMTAHSARYPSQLSGGERQRMALARALAVEPRVLLLDEPFGSLDTNVRIELREWLRRFHDQAHVTTLLVTHDQEEALSIADHIAVMDQGIIQQVGTARELYDRPANNFVMGFLGPVSRLGGQLLRPHDIVVSLDREDGAVKAQVRQTTHLGHEVRLELAVEGQEAVSARLPRREAEHLEVGDGDIVWLRPSGQRLAPDQAPIPLGGVES